MALRTLMVAVMIALAVSACGEGQDPTVGASPSPTGTSAATQTSAPTAESPSEGVAGEPDGSTVERIEITVSDGEADGPGTVSLEAGVEVELVVTSDVADEIHVHGYDLHQDLAAGEVATLTFTADIPGEFEVELEESRIHLVDLQVRG